MEQILGGVIIGVSVSLMLLFNGRVTGISGILGGLLTKGTADKNWRILFLLGLILGGFFLKWFYPSTFNFSSSATTMDYVIAGLLVGVGTTLGNGCTSGHGVCGISRFSKRSIIATIVFIISGAISVVMFKVLRGGL